MITGTVPDFTLVSVIMGADTAHTNLNPHSTLIVKTASAMQGGINPGNLQQARGIVTGELNFGLDTDLIDYINAALAASGMGPAVTESLDVHLAQADGVSAQTTAGPETPSVFLSEMTPAQTGEPVLNVSESTDLPPGDPILIGGRPEISVAEGTASRFTPTVGVSQSENLIFNVINPPPWASFDSTTGTLSGTPGFTAAGNYEAIVISVSDGTTSDPLPPFNIQVTNTNLPPTLFGEPAARVTR